MTSEKKPPAAEKSGLRVWILTAALAAAMIGGAVLVSRRQAAEDSAPPPPPVAAQPREEEKASVATVPPPAPPPVPISPPMPAPAPAPAPVERAEAPGPEKPKAPVTYRPPGESTPLGPLPDQALPPENQGAPALRLDNLAGTLTVMVPVLTSREDRLPLDYTCYRSNVSPPVQWQGAPPGTKSLVLVMERRMEGREPFWSWVVLGIPGDAAGLEKNSARRTEAPLTHGLSDAGAPAYTGPCEPNGKIPYAIRLFALDIAPGLAEGAGKADLIRAMNGHIVDAAEAGFVHYLRF